MFDIATTQQLDLPPVPENLIVPLDQLTNDSRIPLYRDNGSTINVDWYRVYKCNTDLVDWIKATFPFECGQIEYIVCEYALFAHIDQGRTGALNYVIDPGADNVLTEFLSDDKSKVLNSVCYQPGQWHYLNVGIPHQVVWGQDNSVPLPSPRYLISVTPKECVTYTFNWHENNDLSV